MKLRAVKKNSVLSHPLRLLASNIQCVTRSYFLNIWWVDVERSSETGQKARQSWQKLSSTLTENRQTVLLSNVSSSYRKKISPNISTHILHVHTLSSKERNLCKSSCCHGKPRVNLYLQIPESQDESI